MPTTPRHTLMAPPPPHTVALTPPADGRDAMLPRPGHALGRVKARGIQAETLLIDERVLGDSGDKIQQARRGKAAK